MMAGPGAVERPRQRAALPRATELRRELEAEHLDERAAVRPAGEKEILGSEIAVHETACMGLTEGLARLKNEAQALFDGQTSVRGDDAAEVGAIERFEDHVRLTP